MEWQRQFPHAVWPRRQATSLASLWLLKRGRNRIVRRMLKAVGHPVTRLRRLTYGSVKLGELPSGRHRVLSDTEVDLLRGLVEKD